MLEGGGIGLVGPRQGARRGYSRINRGEAGRYWWGGGCCQQRQVDHRVGLVGARAGRGAAGNAVTEKWAAECAL